MPGKKDIKIVTFEGLNLNLLEKILKMIFCKFCFLVAAPPHIYSGKFLILIYYLKTFSTNQNSGFSKFQYSRNNGLCLTCGLY